MTIFDRAFEILASDAFVSSLDDEADLPAETPEPQPETGYIHINWRLAHLGRTGVPGLYWNAKQRLWVVQPPKGERAKVQSSRNIETALSLWYEMFGDDLARARAALRERGLL